MARQPRLGLDPLSRSRARADRENWIASLASCGTAREAVKKQFINLGAVARSSSPEQLKTHISGEIAKWKAVREKAGIEQEQ